MSEPTSSTFKVLVRYYWL